MGSRRDRTPAHLIIPPRSSPTIQAPSAHPQETDMASPGHSSQPHHRPDPDHPLAAPLAFPLSQLSSPAAKLAASVELRRRQESGEPVVNLAFGQSPFPALESAVQALKHYADACHYLPTAGLEELRKLLVEFHEQYDGFEQFTHADVVVGPGARQLVFLIMLAFDGAVFVPTPTWPAYSAQAALSGRLSIPVPASAATGWKLSCDSLDQAARTGGAKPRQAKLLVLCNPDNPSGQAYGRKELESLASYLRSNAFVVVCDEVYARLHFSDEFYSLATYYPEGTVVVSGLSKWAGLGGWRLGYAMFPEELADLRDAVVSASAHTFSCAPTPAQFAAVRLLNDLHSADAYMRHSRRVLAAVSGVAARKLRACGLDATTPQAGYSLLVDFEPLREPLDQVGVTTGAELCERLLVELGVALLPCAGAFNRPDGELTVRLCFVDFDGRRALAESRRLGLQASATSASASNSDDDLLGEAFVRQFCEPTASAVTRLVGWVRRLLGGEPGDDEMDESHSRANGSADGDEEDEPTEAPSAPLLEASSTPSSKDIEEYSKDLVDDVILIAQAEWVGCRL